MKLNSIKPAKGSKPTRTRVGRGIGSGLGKTAGRGHKGQRARSGGYHKVGFEGGQMPIQRRLPKRGFKSPIKMLTGEVRLSEIEKMTATEIDLAALKAAGVVDAMVETAKLIKYPGYEHWTELFDLKADPYETKNLATDPAAKPLLDAMLVEFARQQAAVRYRAP